LELANKDIMLSKDALGIVTFAACLLLFYETDFRNIGHLEKDPVASIALLPMFYLSDLGMLLPVFAAIWLSRAKLMSTGRELLVFFVILSFLYGMAIWFVTNNPVQNIGEDLRFFLALFSGLSLAVLLPSKHEALATAITVASTIGLLIGTVILFSIPDADFISSVQRTTHPSAFSLFGLPLTFIGPSIVYSSLIGDRKLTILSWFNAGMFLLITILIVQTRSLFLTALISIVFAWITIFVLSFHDRQNSGNVNRFEMPWVGVIFCVAFVIVILYWWSGHSDAFLTRLMGFSEFEEDPSIIPRLLELPTIFESMDLSAHIFGVGLNPHMILTDWDGTPYNTSHIGVINVWWRLGFPIFLIMVLLFVFLMMNWVRSLAHIYRQPLNNKVTSETFGLMVCWSGVASIFFVSCMSGGWSKSTMLPLGILWGIYRVGTGQNVQ